MAVREEPDDRAVVALSNLPPTPRQSWSAIIAGAALLVGFGVLAPFARMPLTRLDGFIPALDATIFVTDFMTSALLFGQFSISRSRALLALASGYFFSALVVVAHALSFPGAFSPTGNLGGDGETTLRLYLLWHLGFPAALLAFTWIKDETVPSTVGRMGTTTAIAWSAVVVCGVVCCAVWLSVAGAKFLPSVRAQPGQFSLIASWAIEIAMMISAIAFAALWIRRRSVLDQWLMIVAFASIVELALTAVLGGPRFSLGFYTGRIFSVVTSTVVLIILLTEATRLHARLARSNTLLQRERDNKLMNIEAVTASIAHELRQPLTSIAANAGAIKHFLKMAPPEIDEALSATGEMIDESNRAGEALDGIRSLFRKSDQRPQRIDVNGLALDALQTMRAELRDHDVTIIPELTADLPPIRGNRGQLQEVLLNLVHNAVEAMDATTDRSRQLRVVTQHRGRDAIAVSVQDSGPGIDPKRLDDIFDAFVTTKPHGMGLGLAICRMIIERHGGQLTAWSDGKSGALFQFVLPLEALETAMAPAQ